MTREDLIADTAHTLVDLNAKVREALTMGKPSEASDYASALWSAAQAYLCLEGETDE